MSNNNDIPTNKKAINSYINNWRGNNPSIIQIKQKEEEFNQLKLQYEDAYKTYIQNVERGSKKNYTLNTGQNVHGVEELIEKNKVRYIRVEHNFQYIHINEMEVFDEYDTNIAKNFVQKKMKITITTAYGKWNGTSRLNWISFTDGNKEVTKRYELKGKNIFMGSSTSLEIPVNFSNQSVNGMKYYIGNDGAKIKQIKLEMFNEDTNDWELLIGNAAPSIEDKEDNKKPGCYVYSETGCPKHKGFNTIPPPDTAVPFTANKWDLDRWGMKYGQPGSGKSEEDCNRRGPQYNAWCGTNDFKTKFVAKPNKNGDYGSGKWIKNSENHVKFNKSIKFERNPNGPDAYASSEIHNGDANKIIDGNHEAVAWWPSANSNHTLNRENEYIELDLKKSHNVKRIRIWNRPDCCNWRLYKAKMKFFNDARQQVGKTYTLGSSRIQDYNIKMDNQPTKGKLEKAFPQWINNSKCNTLCAEDEDCALSLWRPQTWSRALGWSWGNECLHYSNDIGKSESINNPNYQYTAYNKPLWENKLNKNYGEGMIAKEDDNNNFKYLGKSSTFGGCKNEAEKSDKGPFDAVVYYSNKIKEDEWKNECYGAFMGGKKNIQTYDGVYTAIPPGGQTGQITQEYLNSLQDIIYLNKKLSKLGNELVDLNMKIYKSGEQYESKLQQINFSVDNKKLTELQHLENDRKKLIRIQNDIQDLKKQEENDEYQLTTNQYQYLSLSIVALGLVGLTFHQINKR